jgi:CHRD domain
MRTARLGGVVAAAAALLLLGAGPALAEQVTITASGSGAEEAPAPGQEGATIRGTFTIDTDTGSITYTVSVAGNTEPVGAAHIHQAPRGTAGPVVVPLDTAAVAAGTQATTTVDPAIAAQIAASPENYYVNAHSATFPGGFARGQLSDAAPGSVSAGDGSSAADTRALLGAALLAAGAGAVALGVARRRGAAR